MKNYGHFMDELYSYRSQTDLSIEQAAALAGVSSNTYRKWESTNRHPVFILNLMKAYSGLFWDDWKWDPVNEVLYDPKGREVHRGTIQAAWHAQEASRAILAEYYSNAEKYGYRGHCFKQMVPRVNHTYYPANDIDYLLAN